ncbi:ATP-grasp domain-containing protein [Thalassotalea euphylliae]|uniref:ATP-grasp domain-containing protein n=1 Tax=Thalassotalea euphylliae TaxID=1655234 RepID=A0A3E0TR12_9GAMM|nr:ATP-grasp domain-containing protein [Thalassotalea euphylliae]REL26893.1 ATP-grasp domain-containing protein [Thalassotalea euphylliae]
MKIKKIILATESQHSWAPSKYLDLSDTQVNELKQYLPTPQQSIELLHNLGVAASKSGIDIEHIVINDITSAMDKIRLSSNNDSCVWIVSDGRIFHNSGPLCAWLKQLDIKTYGIDTTIQSLTDNKYLMSVIAQKHGIKVPESRLYRGKDEVAVLDGFSSNEGYFVKPNTLGSQIGISRASKVNSLKEAVSLSEALHEAYGVEAIIQSYIAGKDYRIPVIESKDQVVNFSCCEVSVINKSGEEQDFSTNRIECDRRWSLNTVTDKSSEAFSSAAHAVNQLYKLGLIADYSGVDMRGSDETGYFFLENNVKPFVDQSFKLLARSIGYDSMGAMFLESIQRDNNRLY